MNRQFINALCGVRGTFIARKPVLPNVHAHIKLSQPGVLKISVAHYADSRETSHFLDYNKIVYPPLELGEEPRPAYVCHQKLNIKYSLKKLYLIACLVRGMSIDEAIKQLKQVPRKGAFVIIDTLKEAQELAVKEHNVEFKSNLWVAESFTGKGICIKGMRRHAKMRTGEIRYAYSHYFVRLEEGAPPQQYYWGLPRDGPSLLQRYVDELRRRPIKNSL